MSTKGPKGSVKISGGTFMTGTFKIPNLQSDFLSMMPAGHWMLDGRASSEGRRASSPDEFFPGKFKGVTVTRGSKARKASRVTKSFVRGNRGGYFLNVAYSSFTKNAPAIYEQIIHEQVSRALKSSKGSKFKEPNGLLKPGLNIFR